MPNFDQLKIVNTYVGTIEELKNLNSTDEKVTALISSLKKLQETIDHQNEKVGINKNIAKILDEDGKKELLTRYGEVATLLRKMGADKKDPQNPTIFSNILDSVSSEVFCLQNHDSEKRPMSLSQLYETSKSMNVDISGMNLGKVGGNLSSRIPFSYTSPEGISYEGFFTKSEIFNTRNELKKFMDQVRNLSKETGDIFSRIVEGNVQTKVDEAKKMISERIKSGEWDTMPDDDALYRIAFNNYGASILKKDMHAFSISDDAFKSMLSQMTKDEKKVLSTNNLAVGMFRKGLGDVWNKLGLNMTCGIGENSRIDSRNAALSTLASLLGRPEIVAKSIPMSITVNGEKINGTFMANGNGMDSRHRKEHELMIGTEHLNRTSGLSSLADLQILDFISGNIDRHGGNFLYRFKNGQFQHVVGIDNDLSFGTLIPKKDDPTQRLPGYRQLGVMSQSMAEKVMSLKKSTLVNTLQPFNLSREQIRACVSRLEIVQKEIQRSKDAYEKHYQQKPADAQNRLHSLKGYIKIIPDDDFKKYTIDELQKVSGNVKEGIYNRTAELDRFREMEPENLTQMKDVSKQKYSFDAVAVQQYQKDGMRFLEEMEAKTGVRGTSTEFENLRDAMMEYEVFHKNNRGQMLSQENIMRHDKLLQKIEKFSDIYLEHHEKKIRKSSYANARADLVSDIKEYTHQAGIMRDGKSLSPEEVKVVQSQNDFNVDAINAKLKAEAMKTVVIATLAEDGRKLEKLAKDPTKEQEFMEAVKDHMVHKDVMQRYADQKGRITLKNFDKVTMELKDTQKAKDSLQNNDDFSKLVNKLKLPENRTAYAHNALEQVGLKPREEKIKSVQTKKELSPTVKS